MAIKQELIWPNGATRQAKMVQRNPCQNFIPIHDSIHTERNVVAFLLIATHVEDLIDLAQKAKAKPYSVKAHPHDTCKSYAQLLQ